MSRPEPRSSRTGSSSRTVGVGLVALLAALVTAPTPAPPASAAVATPFAASSPFNVPIPQRPQLDPRSPAMVARVSRSGRMYANLVAYGIPIYTAKATTPRHQVRCDLEGTWGTCPLGRQPMPIPRRAQPNSGDDGVLTVLDPATNTVAEYWRARRSGDGWAASFGAVNALGGSGWGGSSTGAGASRLAGVIRVREIERGVIPHALVLQSDNACATTFRPPARKTDGASTRSDCLPEGARLQLDPSLDLDSMRLTKAERAVARAMQVYGGYLIDRSGTSLSVSFERAPDADAGSPGSTYRAAGLRWDYDGLEGVPWERLRVLESWQGR